MRRFTVLATMGVLFLGLSVKAHAIGYQVFLGGFRPADETWSERYGGTVFEGAVCLSGFWKPIGARFEIEFGGRKYEDPLDYHRSGRYEFKGELDTFRFRLSAFAACAPSEHSLLYVGAGPTFVTFKETVGTHDPTLTDPHNYRDRLRFDDTSGSGLALHAVAGINLNLLVLEVVYETGSIYDGKRDVDVGGITYRLGMGFFFQR